MKTFLKWMAGEKKSAKQSELSEKSEPKELCNFENITICGHTDSKTTPFGIETLQDKEKNEIIGYGICLGGYAIDKNIYKTIDDAEAALEEPTWEILLNVISMAVQKINEYEKLQKSIENEKDNRGEQA